jgi:TonB family protein
MWLLALLAAAPPPLVVAPPPLPVAPVPPRVAVPATGPPSLAALVSNEDYPPEALRNEQQGTVAVTLAIDATGRVSRCRVTESSGFVSLDRATCRLLSARARFSPARDAAGRAVPDTYPQRIRWTISEAYDPALDSAQRDWMRCLAEAARPLVRTIGLDEAVADRSFPRCTAEEAKLLALLPPPVAIPPDPAPTPSAAARATVRPALLDLIAAMR